MTLTSPDRRYSLRVCAQVRPVLPRPSVLHNASTPFLFGSGVDFFLSALFHLPHSPLQVALFTDSTIKKQPFFHTVLGSLEDAGAEVVVYDQTLVEPTDVSLQQAIEFAADVNPDGFVGFSPPPTR